MSSKIQSKNILKVRFEDFWTSFDIKDNFILQALKEYFTVEIVTSKDSSKPDVVFFSNFGLKNYKYSNCIRIYITGEADCPNFNICDYATGLVDLKFSNRYLRLNFFYLSKDQYIELKQNSMENICDLINRESFCCIVSNKERNPIFFNFYNKLSKYKKISSGGKWNNNIGVNVNNKFKFINKFKFNICFENELIEGYVTEKIYHSFLCDTIPIYWGSDYVNYEYQGFKFIYINKYNTIDEAIKDIIEIDNNNDLYLSLIKNNKKRVLPILNNEITKLGEFLNSSINQGSIINYNRGIYNKFYLYMKSLYELQNSSLYKIYRQLKKIIRHNI